jgi:hypothetical protein
MQAAMFTQKAAMAGCAAPLKAAASIRSSSARPSFVVRASSVAAPVQLDVKKLDGSAAGSASLSLKVADADTANGLVHRYLVMVRQNARQVRPSTMPACAGCPLPTSTPSIAHPGLLTRRKPQCVAGWAMWRGLRRRRRRFAASFAPCVAAALSIFFAHRRAMQAP